MSTGTLWALCSNSAPSLNSPKPSPPPPQGNRSHFRQTTGRPDHVGPSLCLCRGGLQSALFVCRTLPRHSRTPRPGWFCGTERSRPTFSSRFAPAKRSACECEKSLPSSMRARKMFVHHLPFLSLFRKHMRATPVDLVPSPELHAPIKRRHCRPSAHRHVRLFHVVRPLRRAPQVVVKRFPQRPQPANPLVLRRRKPHEPTV